MTKTKAALGLFGICFFIWSFDIRISFGDSGFGIRRFRRNGIRPPARELLMQLDPQDAAERMLAVQMIAAFSRSMFLARNANHQKHPKWFALYSTECDRSMAQFRRQIQTLTDLRRPRRTTFNAIRQANIAGQQIVVNEVE